MKVNFIDLGAYNGDTIDLFLKEMEGIPNVDIKVYGVEALSIFAEYAKDKYAKDPRVRIDHLAIGSTEGIIPIYSSVKSEKSWSIYKNRSRINTSTKYLKVKSTKFSTWLATTDISPDDFNIIKSNMEGAEIDLVNDMEANDLFKWFDIYTGNMEYWTNDVKKIDGAAEQVEHGGNYGRNILHRR